MFYITVSNGLLEGDHHDRMGNAVWLFMWLIDKVTRIDDSGWGWVLGGKPINLDDVKHIPRRSVQRYLATLKKEGYIEVKYTMYGFIVKVAKAKKRFGSGTPKVAHLDDAAGAPEMAHPHTKSGAPRAKSGAPNKTIQLDKTEDKDAATRGVAREKASFNPLGSEIIKAFEAVDAKNKTYYANTTQRKACDFLLDQYGLDAVLLRVKVLPQTNKVPYFPSITTPHELKEKWSKLEDAVARKRSAETSNVKIV
jgi:hypothetical protein